MSEEIKPIDALLMSDGEYKAALAEIRRGRIAKINEIEMRQFIERTKARLNQKEI